MSNSDRIAITKQLLAQGLKGSKNEPDLQLSLWIQAMPVKDRATCISEILTEKDISDDFKKRLWTIVVNDISNYDIQFFVENIPKIIAQSELNRTHQAIIQSIDLMNSAFPSDKEKSALSESILLSIIKSSSIDKKRQLTKWLHAIGGSAKLSKLNNYTDELDDETLSIFMDIFPEKRRSIQKIKKAVSGKSGE